MSVGTVRELSFQRRVAGNYAEAYEFMYREMAQLRIEKNALRGEGDGVQGRATARSEPHGSYTNEGEILAGPPGGGVPGMGQGPAPSPPAIGTRSRMLPPGVNARGALGRRPPRCTGAARTRLVALGANS